MSAPAQLPPRAWLIVGLLWVVACLNYLDRVMITTMHDSLVAAIPMTEAQFGLLTSVFLWVYALLSPLAGFLADRFSRSRLIVGSLFAWSAMTWLTAHAQTFGQLLTARALMGISEAAYIPAALSLITDYHRGATRSLATGVHHTGVVAGAGLGGFGGLIAERHGWTQAFNVFGIGGLIVFGMGRAFADVNTMPMLCQVANPRCRATGYGVMNFVATAVGGITIWAGGALRDVHVNLSLVFQCGAAGYVLCSVLLLFVKPTATIANPPGLELAK